VITTTMTLAQDPADVDTGSIAAQTSTVTGISTEFINVTVAPGSAIVTTQITPRSQATSASAQTALNVAFSSSANIAAAYPGVTVIGIPSVATVRRGVSNYGPSPPPPSPPPSPPYYYPGTPPYPSAPSPPAFPSPGPPPGPGTDWVLIAYMCLFAIVSSAVISTVAYYYYVKKVKMTAIMIEA